MNESVEDQRLNTGRRIKMARNLAGISRKDLETKYGISMHTLQSWELGRNPLTEKAALKLVEILHSTGINCSTQWLLEGIGKSPSILGADFQPFISSDKRLSSLFTQESVIQKEIEFFKSNNPNAMVVMVSDDTMEPIYCKGDFIGGIQYFDTDDIKKCMGYDCIVEISEGIYFRRVIQRNNGYALVCLNAHTKLEDPIIFTKKILTIAPVIWHRWMFNKQE